MSAWKCQIRLLLSKFVQVWPACRRPAYGYISCFFPPQLNKQSLRKLFHTFWVHFLLKTLAKNIRISSFWCRHVVRLFTRVLISTCGPSLSLKNTFLLISFNFFCWMRTNYRKTKLSKSSRGILCEYLFYLTARTRPVAVKLGSAGSRLRKPSSTFSNNGRSIFRSEIHECVLERRKNKKFLYYTKI